MGYYRSIVPILTRRRHGGLFPVVQANFASALAGDYDTLSTTSSMPDGGLITRAGNAMVWVNDGGTAKLTWAPNNLLTYSEQFNQYNGSTSGAWYPSTAPGTFVTANVATAPDGTLTADQLAFPSSSDFIIQDYSTNVAGKTFIFSVYIRAAAATTCRIRITQSGGGNAVSTVSVTTSWQRAYILYSTDASATFVRATIQPDTSNAPTILVWGAQLEQVTYQTTPSTYVATTSAAYYGPRFDYDPATLAAKGLLVEGARTNICLYSEDFRDTATVGSARPWAWTSATAGFTSATTAPNGTTNATFILPSAASSQHFITQSIVSSGTTTFSVYMKAAGYRWAALGGSGNGIALFDLQNGVVGTTVSAGVTAKIQSVGNGWYRCSVTQAYSTATNYIFVQPSDAQATWTPDGVSGIYVFGAQFEQATFASSYIPNLATGSTARAAETFTLANYQNRLVESFYIDEQTGGSWSANINASATSPLTISTPTFGWVTSLRTYTNAYAGDITTPSWIDNSGTTGNRMYYDSTGALTWAPANLIQQSQTFGAAYWSKTAVTVSADATTAPDGTTTADNIISTVGTGEQRIFANPMPSTVGYRYTYSVYAKTSGANWLVLRDDARGFADTSFDLVNGAVGTVGSGRTASILSVGSGWYRCAVTVEVSASWVVGSVSFCLADVDNGRATFVGNGIKGIYLWGAQLESVTYQASPRAYIPTTSAAVYQPRFDYSPSTLSPLGLLIEESRSNLLTYSEQFDNAAWTKASASITANAATSPDGTTTADLLTATAASGYVFPSAGLLASAGGANYTYSVYAKAGTSDTMQLLVGAASTYNATYTFSTGATSSVSANASATMTACGNGWYRLTLTCNSVANNAYSELQIGRLASGLTVYLWGAQLEAGSFPTSYIPTTTGSVTRVADVVKLSGSALTTAQSGTASAAAQTSKLLEAGAANHVILGAFSGGYRYLLYSNFSNSSISAATSGSYGVAIGASGTFTGGSVRGVVGWDANGTSIVANNGAVNPSTSFKINSTANNVYLGTSGSGEYLDGWVASLALYNQRLPDAILKQKSTVGSPY